MLDICKKENLCDKEDSIGNSYIVSYVILDETTSSEVGSKIAILR